MTHLQAGDPAPEFTLPDQNGEKHTLSDYRGRWVLVYFYPRDNTPGCTKEACGLRDQFPAFEKMNTVVFGISTDSVKSHKKFEQKFSLPFTLLADEEKKVVRLYGVWGAKKFMGRVFEGTHRLSFLVAPDGKIAKVYTKVKPDAHAAEVLQDVQTFAAG